MASRALLVRGQIAYQYPDLITTLGSGTAFRIPLGIDAAGKAMFIPIGWTIIVCLLFLLVGHLVLKYTRYGRYIYMVGGNREAAEYSGVNVKFIIGSVMVICAVCSGVAGMLGVAYFGSAQQNQFDTFLLDAIAAVVVGGTSLFGGRGGIGNTIIGLLVWVWCQQRPRPHPDRLVPQDPHPRSHPARGADHQRLCAGAERKTVGSRLRLTLLFPSPTPRFARGPPPLPSSNGRGRFCLLPLFLREKKGPAQRGDEGIDYSSI